MNKIILFEKCVIENKFEKIIILKYWYQTGINELYIRVLWHSKISIKFSKVGMPPQTSRVGEHESISNCYTKYDRTFKTKIFN